MKILQTLFFCLFLFSCSSSQYTPEKSIYLDPKGIPVSEKQFHQESRNGLSHWSYIANGQRYDQLSPLF